MSCGAGRAGSVPGAGVEQGLGASQRHPPSAPPWTGHQGRCGQVDGAAFPPSGSQPGTHRALPMASLSPEKTGGTSLSCHSPGFSGKWV